MQPTSRHLMRVGYGIIVFKLVYVFACLVALDATGKLEDPELRHFAMWDGWHYLKLSIVGYGANDESSRFFPLFPICISAVAPLAAGSHLVAGWILSNLFSSVAFLLFFYFTFLKHGEDTAKWSLAFLLAFPGALFYQMVYSESLFLLMIILTWIALERKAYIWVAALAVVLPLIRPNGVFIGIPILWHLFRNVPLPIRGYASWFRPSQSPADGQESGDSKKTCLKVLWELRFHTVLLAPLAGWMLYLIFMRARTGNVWAGFDTQLQSHNVWNLINVPKFIRSFFTASHWHEFESSVLDRCIFVVFLCTVPAQWRLGKSYLAWSYMLGLLPAMSGEYSSFTRYVAPAFPVFLAFGHVFGRPGRTFLRWGIIILFLLLNAILSWRFINFRWAG